MVEGVTYYRRTAERVVATPDAAQVFLDWKGADECWMFVGPHDDDVVTAAGLTFLAALAEGVQVHAVIATDGRMGYCRFPQRRTISKIRMSEAQASFQILGLPRERLHFLGFPDCNLNHYRGRHFTTIGDPTEIEGASGMQNAFPYILRKVRPNRIFLPTSTDLHPDHRIVNQEMLISLFHAQGNIWPELGDPIQTIPAVYEYATYCDFPEPPQIRIDASQTMLDTKLEAIRAYASQEQIELLIQVQRDVGPVEYIREVRFNVYNPRQYHALFGKEEG